MYPQIQSITNSRSLRAILESKDLAQIGDSLVNFVYSTVRIGIKGQSGSGHVWDNSLRDAMELADLRKHLGKRAKPGRVADAAEALVAYSYFNKIMSLEEMIVFVSQRIGDEDYTSVVSEKMACATSFGDLLAHLFQLLQREDKIDIIQQ